jgi:hypothetical protein
LLAGEKGEPGDSIGQLQNDETYNRVATLYHEHAGAGMDVDAALAVLDNPDMWSNDIEGLSIHPRKIAEKSDIEILNQSKARVRKSGSVTSVTEGTIEHTNAVVDVSYPLSGVTRRKVGQLLIKGSNGVFSLEGDSGACVVSEDGTAVALLIAGNEITGESWATPMYVLRDLLGFSLRTN